MPCCTSAALATPVIPANAIAATIRPPTTNNKRCRRIGTLLPRCGSSIPFGLSSAVPFPHRTSCGLESRRRCIAPRPERRSTDLETCREVTTENPGAQDAARVVSDLDLLRPARLGAPDASGGRHAELAAHRAVDVLLR